MTRSCSDCSLCCYLPGITELEKPANTWCHFCKPGNGGCSIYPNHPPVCQQFRCQWLASPNMFGEEWRPDRSGMVIAFDNTGERLLCRIYVHPKKQRWREPQFRPMLGRIAETGLVGKRNYHTLICIGDRIILLLPDDEIEITGRAYAVRQENGQWRGYTFPTAEQARQFALAS